MANQIDPQRTAKKCSVCEQLRRREEYYPNKCMKDGMASMCIECQKLSSTVRLLYKMNKEELVAEKVAAQKKIDRIVMVESGVQLTELIRKERGVS